MSKIKCQRCKSFKLPFPPPKKVPTLEQLTNLTKAMKRHNLPKLCHRFNDSYISYVLASYMEAEADEKMDIAYDEFFNVLLNCDYEKKNYLTNNPNYERYSRLSLEKREYYRFEFRYRHIDFIEKVFYFQPPTYKFIRSLCQFIKHQADVDTESIINITIRQILETKMITADELLSEVYDGIDLPPCFLIDPMGVIDLLYEFNASEINIKKIASLIFESTMFSPRLFISNRYSYRGGYEEMDMILYKFLNDGQLPSREKMRIFIEWEIMEYMKQEYYSDEELEARFYAKVLRCVGLKDREELKYFDLYCVTNTYITSILRQVSIMGYNYLLKPEYSYPYNSYTDVIDHIRTIVKHGKETDPNELLPLEEVVYDQEKERLHALIFTNHLLDKLIQVHDLNSHLKHYLERLKIDPALVRDPGVVVRMFYAICRHRTLHSYFEKLFYGNMIKFSPVYKILFPTIYRILFGFYEKKIYLTINDLCSRYDDITQFYTRSLSDHTPAFVWLITITNHIIPFFNLILEFSPISILISDWQKTFYHSGICRNLKRLFGFNERFAKIVAKYMI